MISTQVLVMQEPGVPDQDLLQLLEAEGYQAHTTGLQEAVSHLSMIPPDLAVLNLRHLGRNTHPLCQELCRQAKSLILPLMLLIETCHEVGLPRECDACLVRPLPSWQIAAVIKILLQNNAPQMLAAGGVRLHLDTHQVYSRESSYHLSPREFRLLETLMRHPARVLTRRFLMRQVWDTDFVQDTRTLDVHIHCLRRKMEPNPSRPLYVRTVRGVGYHFVPTWPEL